MNIKKSNKLKDRLKKMEADPSADKAKIAELQALIYGAGWHTIA